MYSLAFQLCFHCDRVFNTMQLTCHFTGCANEKGHWYFRFSLNAERESRIQWIMEHALEKEYVIF